MQRDLAVFPSDENGEVLWLAHGKGFRIGEEHRIRQAIVFPEQNDSLKFGLFLLRQGYWVQVNELDDKPGYSGEVLVDVVLELTHQEVSGAESWLAEQSASLSGKIDGWEIKGKVPSFVGAEFKEFPSTPGAV